MIENGMTIGSMFGFIWNLMISGSFQFIGFVLTFLLHSTHAAKYGSLTGLGISVAQFGAHLLYRLKKAKSDSEQDESKRATPGQMWHARFACYLVLCLGVFVGLYSTIQYLRLYRKSAKIVSTTRQQERAAIAVTSESSEPPSGFLEGWFQNAVFALQQGIARWRDFLLSDLGLLGSVAVEPSAEDFVIRPGFGIQPRTVVFAEEDMQVRYTREAMQHHWGTSNAWHDDLDPNLHHELQSVRLA